MSGYHSFELCYLAAIYSNLLIFKHPMDFYFKPAPASFPDNILRVAPDLLPPGSIRIDSVTIDGQDHTDFDADNLTVTLPPASAPVRVKVRLAPTSGVEHFAVETAIEGTKATLTLCGDLNVRALGDFRAAFDRIIAAQVGDLTIDARQLDSISSEGARELVFGRAKLRLDEKITVSGANDAVEKVLVQDEFAESITVKAA
jgi:anti-anti-sigma regulatory factor